MHFSRDFRDFIPHTLTLPLPLLLYVSFPLSICSLFLSFCVFPSLFLSHLNVHRESQNLWHFSICKCNEAQPSLSFLHTLRKKKCGKRKRRIEVCKQLAIYPVALQKYQFTFLLCLFKVLKYWKPLTLCISFTVYRLGICSIHTFYM